MIHRNQDILFGRDEYSTKFNRIERDESMINGVKPKKISVKLRFFQIERAGRKVVETIKSIFKKVL